MLGLRASAMIHCSLASNLAQSWPGPSCSKVGSDNPGLVLDLNSDMKA